MIKVNFFVLVFDIICKIKGDVIVVVPSDYVLSHFKFLFLLLMIWIVVEWVFLVESGKFSQRVYNIELSYWQFTIMDVDILSSSVFIIDKLLRNSLIFIF